MRIKVRRSTGNVFRDLGFSKEEAENLKIRTNLMIRLSKLIETRRLTQAQAARLFEVTQPWFPIIGHRVLLDSWWPRASG